jgi:hypothetical protein
MTLKIRIKRPLFQSSRPKYGARRPSHATAGGDRTFLDTLAERADSQQLEALRNQQVQRPPITSRILEEVPEPEPTPISKGNTATPSVSPSDLRPVRKEASPPPSPPRSGTMMRVFSWLQKRATLRATKQLRVSETVSLGEKRFVAIIQVEDRKFLIGGGASSVSLLTQLDAATESVSIPVGSIPAPEPLPRLRGVY